MIERIMQIVAPHYCYSCNKTGDLLCLSCIYNITYDFQNECIECRKPCLEGVCVKCELPFKKAWVVGVNQEELSKLIKDYKWSRKYAGYKSMGMLLDKVVPILPENVVVVPVPTISKHVRIRGYDHAYLVAEYFSKRRSLKVRKLLKRKQNTIQHTAKRLQRIKQAQDAFYCNEKLDPSVPYLVLDDIVTTGSTTKAATRVLMRAGAREVWVAAVARQLLQK